MDRLQFEVPVRIALEPGLPVEEIYGVEQALDLLQDWPARKHAYSNETGRRFRELTGRFFQRYTGRGSEAKPDGLERP